MIPLTTRACYTVSAAEESPRGNLQVIGMKGPETQTSHHRRLYTHFFDIYMQGTGLDIGYKGDPPCDETVAPNAIGVDLDYPGYDGKNLPFESGSQDFVYASHVLEHITDYTFALREWMRVTKIGGFIIIGVPHQFLYEKRMGPPSKFNADHKRFYTPASLMWEIESSLEPNTYRLRHLQDCDIGYDYAVGPERHSNHEYQIECVIQRIQPPVWKLQP